MDKFRLPILSVIEPYQIVSDNQGDKIGQQHKAYRMNPFSYIKILVFFTAIIFSVQVSGQSLPVGTPVLEDVFRRSQLLGKVNLSASFTSRPFFPTLSQEKLLNSDTLSLLFNEDELHSSASSKRKSEKISFKLLPLTWKQQYNSDHPEGLNDGVLIPARGYQTMVSGGFFAKYGWLSIQLRPELVYAANKAFSGFPDAHPDAIWKSYYNEILIYFDIPEQFGESAYQKVFWGQSSIRLNYRSISFGISNENLWWGPGMQNALLMTNNAPGFKHITLNSIKPINTPIGSFEGQLIAGRLDGSGYPGIDTKRLLRHGIVYQPKPDDWRYLNGMVISYQPRWLPGLFIGATRSFIIYEKNLGSGITDYLPVITPISKKTIGHKTEDSKPRDQLASVFMRWVAPESHMEIYMEYGREDHNYDITDLILEPNHLRAYILGFRKLTPLKRPNEFIDIQVEITELGKSIATSIRAAGAIGWYEHGLVVDGYTHEGQYLGAGIGTSSNMQSLNISWIKDMKRIGLEFKRVEHDENFWAVAFKDYRMHWADIGGAVAGEWNYQKLVFNAKVETVGSINYQFLYNPVPSDPPQHWDHGKIRYNVHAELGISYFF